MPVRLLAMSTKLCAEGQHYPAVDGGEVAVVLSEDVFADVVASGEDELPPGNCK
jgi:hypothetical protein